MIVPEQVYQFTRPQDYMSQRFEVWRKFALVDLPAGFNSGVAEVWTVPQDRALFLTGAHFQYITTVANEAPLTIGIGYCDVGETFSASRALCAGASGFSIAGPASRVLGIGWDGHVLLRSLRPFPHSSIVCFTFLETSSKDVTYSWGK